MLDSNFNARLGDFGLARLSKRTALAYQSTKLVGTFGYMAPEYLLEATAETDVYSFGVLVLVVATGRNPFGDGSSSDQLGLVRWVRGLYDEGRIAEAGDKTLQNGSVWSSQDEGEMEAALKVGLACCAHVPSDRPTMREALTALHGTQTILSRSLPPQFPPRIQHPLFEISAMSFMSDSSDSAIR